MFHDQHFLYRPYRIAKRIVIGLIGGTVLLVGLAMVVLPGPAFVVIPAGLAILSVEFAWARVWLKKAKTKARELASHISRKNANPAESSVPPRS